MPYTIFAFFLLNEQTLLIIGFCYVMTKLIRAAETQKEAEIKKIVQQGKYDMTKNEKIRAQAVALEVGEEFNDWACQISEAIGSEGDEAGENLMLENLVLIKTLSNINKEYLALFNDIDNNKTKIREIVLAEGLDKVILIAQHVKSSKKKAS